MIGNPTGSFIACMLTALILLDMYKQSLEKIANEYSVAGEKNLSRELFLIEIRHII
ncbi:hypothetical protein KDA_39050 [Dictyobacter alpinus]|uniref:Uncharacterized protein n=1 Tax=Dictyobacter alpinus TaxID=2014873 RepID=A0A402BAJ4_9CHLR|nr:hypothetical protein KDA_39050 [Dictyobacter alpinus]